jgi:hypothetical protein
MKVLKRKPVHKKHSAKQFKHHVAHTKAANMRGPMRGGFRF